MELTKEELDQRNRLKTVLKIKGIDRQSFADLISRKIGYINQMLSGNRRVTETAISRLIKRYSDINPDWIMTGKGEQFFIQADEKAPSVEEPGVNYTDQKDDPTAALRGMLEYFKERIDNLEKRVSLLEGRSVVEKKE